MAEIKQVKSLPKEDSEILAPAWKNSKIGYILSLGKIMVVYFKIIVLQLLSSIVLKEIG